MMGIVQSVSQSYAADNETGCPPKNVNHKSDIKKSRQKKT